MTKFKLTDNKKKYGIILHQIEATINFGAIKKGDRGGWIQKIENLSMFGDAWVFGNAEVFGDAKVFGNAKVSGDAWVFGNAKVFGNAEVSGDAAIIHTKDFLMIGPIGSNRFITITKSNKKIKAGCFYGSFDDFYEAVKNKYDYKSDYLFFKTAIKEYLNL